MKRVVVLAVFAGLFASGPISAADFGLSFEWGNLKKCNSGRPNLVPNPKFTFNGLPKDTASIQFRIVDTNNPGYNHGGGTAKYSGGSTIAPGAFKYMSPCPPGGRHTYKWTAVAKDAGGKKLGQATASRKYP